MSEQCHVKMGEEKLGNDEPFKSVYCLLPKGHDGPHADWTAWLGVKNPNFSKPGASYGGKGQTKI